MWFRYYFCFVSQTDIRSWRTSTLGAARLNYTFSIEVVKKIIPFFLVAIVFAYLMIFTDGIWWIISCRFRKRILFRWRSLVSTSTSICRMTWLCICNRSGEIYGFFFLRCHYICMFGEPHRRDRRGHRLVNPLHRFVSSTKTGSPRTSLVEHPDQTVHWIHSPGRHGYSHEREASGCFSVARILQLR